MATTKTKRVRKAKVSPAASGLLAALHFVNIAQKEGGPAEYSHCSIRNGFAVGTDGVLSAGARLDADLDACPQTGQLIAALKACGKTLALTKHEAALTVKSDDYVANVSCETLPVVAFPDPPCGPVDDRLTAGFGLLNMLLSNTSPFVACTALYLQSGSMLASNNVVLFEYWHGMSFPPKLLPKSFLSAVVKAGKQLKAFGFSEETFTLHFDDESWIKTQCYNVADYPIGAFQACLNRPANAEPITSGLFDAVTAVAPFCEGSVYFSEGALSSHTDGTGMIYQLDGLRGGYAMALKDVLLLRGVADTLDVTSHNDCALFFGSNVRGAIVKAR